MGYTKLGAPLATVSGNRQSALHRLVQRQSRAAQGAKKRNGHAHSAGRLSPLERPQWQDLQNQTMQALEIVEQIKEEA